MICFHHNDADGRCAAYLVKTLTQNEDSRFVEMDYGKLFDLSMIHPEEVVYIVDYSITPLEMKRLLEITKNVIWIDHHKTAIDKFKDYPEPIPGLRVDGVAACVLTYIFLSGGELIGDLNKSVTPLFVRLIGDYDIWKFEYGDDTRAFHAGLLSRDYTPSSTLWKFLEYDEECYNLVNDGYIIMNYKKAFAKEYLNSFSEKVMFDGYKALTVNIGNVSSDFFESASKDGYDLFISYVIDDGLWRISLRSPKDIDVSEIAKRYGGGGHRGAAGFQCKELPFKKDVLWYENI